MVAYSFKKFFSPQISTGIKRQTVRAERRRHARPGEMIQLYEGMRTRHCRKIRPDVVCDSIEAIRIEVHHDGIRYICFDGRVLSGEALEIFAREDGFAPEHINGHCIDMFGKSGIENMSRFWLDNHGEGLFEGVLIRWRP